MAGRSPVPLPRRWDIRDGVCWPRLAACRAFLALARVMARLVLWAPNEFSAQWVRTHYLSNLLEAIQRIHGLPLDYSIEIICRTDTA